MQLELGYHEFLHKIHIRTCKTIRFRCWSLDILPNTLSFWRSGLCTEHCMVGFILILPAGLCGPLIRVCWLYLAPSPLFSLSQSNHPIYPHSLCKCYFDSWKWAQRRPLYINGERVDSLHTFRFLWVQISDDLPWTHNTTAVIKKAQQRLHFLRVQTGQ